MYELEVNSNIILRQARAHLFAHSLMVSSIAI